MPALSLALGILIGSAAFVLYVLFGYPLWLASISRKQARQVHTAVTSKTVTIILPVRNGERWVAEKLRSILALDYPRELVNVIVISDGSTDHTDEIVARFDSERIQLVRLPSAGKATAINHGLSLATGEIIFFTDVRQRLDRDSLRHLVDCFSDPTVGVVSGELVILGGEDQEQANVGLYWKYEKWIRCNLSKLDSVLGATGCIYAMRKCLAVSLPLDTLLDDVYQPMAAFLKGYRVILETKAKAFDYPTALSSEFRRKVRTLAGVLQIVYFYPRLLSFSNRMWIHFVSHKIGRLLLPFALLAVLGSSLMLTGAGAAFVLACQALFYSLALADLWIPDGWRVKRISSPIRVFVVLMIAALCAFSVLFRNAQAMWNVTEVRPPSRDLGMTV